MALIPNVRALRAHFDGKPRYVREFFWHMPDLIAESAKFEIALAYSFLRTELAQNRTLYGGALRLYQAHSEVAQSLIDAQHLTRATFKELYKNTFGKAVSGSVEANFDNAQRVRNRIIHGKTVPTPDIRNALAAIFDYASGLDQEVFAIANFHPFGDMRGIRGRQGSLNKKTTRWLMKGLGYGKSGDAPAA
jgi:hypothetical protein